MPPTTSFPPVTYGPNGNLYPALVNGLPLNLPAGTTLGGGTVPLLGTGGRLANATMPLGVQLYDSLANLAVDLSSPDGLVSFFGDAVTIDAGGGIVAQGQVAADSFLGDGSILTNLYGLTLAANQSVRRNSGNSAYEAFQAQPIAAGLTSWGSVTRASGFDTFVTTPSSANLAALITDENGTAGKVLFANGTINITSGKTVAFGNSMTLNGFDGSLFTFPNFASDTVAVLGGAQTLSNKTFVAPALGTPASGNASNLTNINIASANVTGRVGSANLPLGAQLYDNAGTPKLAVDFGIRQLISNGSVAAMDWSDPVLLVFFGAASINSEGFFTGSSATLANSDFSHKLKYATISDDGAPRDGFWLPNNDPISSADGNTYFNNSGFTGTITDGSLPCLKNTSRQLIANDGSTVALDWSDPTALVLFGTVSFLDDGTVTGLTLPPGTQLGTQFRVGPGNTYDLVAYSANNNIPVITFDPGDDFSPSLHGKHLSQDGNTYFDNSGFHGVGSVIAGTKTATGTATTTFTVTIGVTMANTTYKVTTEGDNALSSAVHYVNNKTTTTFDIVYLAGLSGPVSIDWIVSP